MNVRQAISPNLNQRQSKTHAFYGSQGVVLQIILLAVITVLAFWFLVRPKQASVSAQRAEFKQLEESKRSATEMLTRLNGLVAELAKSEPETAKLDQLLPLDSRPTKIQIMLQRYVETTGMSLANVAVDFPPEEDIVAAGDADLAREPFPSPRTRRIASVTLQANGQMTQLENLLRSIESGSRLFDIQMLEIKGQEGDSLAVRMKLNTYFYLP